MNQSGARIRICTGRLPGSGLTLKIRNLFYSDVRFFYILKLANAITKFLIVSRFFRQGIKYSYKQLYIMHFFCTRFAIFYNSCVTVAGLVCKAHVFSCRNTCQNFFNFRYFHSACRHFDMSKLIILTFEHCKQ